MKTYYKFFLGYFAIFLFVSFGVYSVFSTDLFFDAKIIKKDSISKNLFLDSNNLNSNIVYFISSNNLEDYKLNSFCKNESKFLYKKENLYFFEIQILDKNCKTNFVYLEKNSEAVKKSFINFNFFSKEKLFDLYTEKTDKELEKTLENLEKILEKLKNNLNKKDIKLIQKLENLRKIKELNYQKSFLRKIIEERQKKYLVPVSGYKISTRKNRLPNAGRPYRSGYTDGIHHGWDFPAPLNTPVQALAYGKIIRIVRDFKFSDLNKIKRKNLTYDDKTKNLDILRGNQVWLKTSSGDVVFYSHLRNIPKDLKVGDLIEEKTPLGYVGVSGIPDKSYTDYHLHLPIMINPKNQSGKYSFLDIMKWDWSFKNKDSEYIIENINKIFRYE